jgi:uncharacterized protein (DUF2147 family)
MSFFSILLFLAIGATAIGQNSIVGKWKTIDDESNEPRSTVEIFEKNGKYYGKIINLFPRPNEDQDPTCLECAEGDDRYQKKIIGMEILRAMERSDDEYAEGNVLDPNNGKIYKCKIWIEANNLKLRGYWGPFFRTQTWLRAQ